MKRLSPPGAHGRPLICIAAKRLLPRCIYCGADLSMYDDTWYGCRVYRCGNVYCPERETANQGFFDEQQMERVYHERIGSNGSSDYAALQTNVGKGTNERAGKQKA